MIYPESPRGVADGWRTANEHFLLDHGQRWLAAFLHTQLPDAPLAQLLQSGRLLGYLAAVVSARQGDNTPDELVAPSRDELAGKKRKVARVLSDVNAFLAMCGRLGVDGRDLFSTSDIVEGRNTPQVCRALWSLSRCCQQLNIPCVPPFASPEEGDQWRGLMPQGSALMVAQRYGRLSTSCRSRESLTHVTSDSSPVKLDDEKSLSLDNGADGTMLRRVLDGGDRRNSLTDDDPRFRTYSGSPVGPSTPSPFEPALSQTATAGSPPEADIDNSPSPPRPRRPEPPRRQSLGFDSQQQEQFVAQRQAVSPVPPLRRGVVRRISADINAASPPPSPVHPAMLAPTKFALSAFRGAPPPVPRAVPVDASSREQQDDRVPPPVPLPKLVESFARPGAQQQQTEQKRPVQQQLSAASGRAVEPDEPEAAASESAASAASETKGFRTIPEAAAVSAGVASEQQASQEGSPPVEWPAEQQASQQASLSMGQHAGRSVGEQQPQQQPQRAAPVVAEPRPRPRSPKQRAAWQPLGICLLGGKHREVPRLLRHAAIAAAGLAAGHLLHSMHARNGHVAVLKCDAVTKIPKHMLKGAVGPKPPRDPWRKVWA